MANLTSIVKVQRPVHTTNPDAGIMVYNAGRDKMVEQPATSQILAAMGAEYKMFFHAVWHPATLQWEIGEPTKWQNW